MSHHLDTPLAGQNGKLYMDYLYVFPADGSTLFVMDVNSTITGPDVQRGFHPEDHALLAVTTLPTPWSGSYRISVYSGIDPLTGRQLRHRRTARTEEQARIVLGRLLEQASTGQRPGSDVKVEEVLTQYLAIAELEPSTRETYEGYIRRTILPALGSTELRKIRGPVLDTFYARLRKCGDLTCTGRPFTEHHSFPALVVERGDPRPGWQQVADTIKDAIGSGQLTSGEQLPSFYADSCPGRRRAAWPGSPRCGARQPSGVSTGRSPGSKGMLTSSQTPSSPCRSTLRFGRTLVPSSASSRANIA